MGFKVPGGISTRSFIRKNMLVHQGKGLGYAMNTPNELEFIKTFAVETGIVLDPVYSGKALYNFLEEIFETDEVEKYRGKNILFWHTGASI
jgi:1-aminocyclopropane-1-carboxylate deaminase/D-cysteine desulfhydrase-like pyridoxal-dependent ACC family enzyme